MFDRFGVDFGNIFNRFEYDFEDLRNNKKTSKTLRFLLIFQGLGVSSFTDFSMIFRSPFQCVFWWCFGGLLGGFGGSFGGVPTSEKPFKNDLKRELKNNTILAPQNHTR